MSEFTDKFEDIGALWKNRTGNGWSGNIKIDGSTIRILVFETKDKKNPKAPDMRIYVEKAKQESAPQSDIDDKDVSF